MFWARHNELTEVRFDFPFNLIGKLTMAFLTGQSWHVLKSWYTGGGPEKDFGAGAQTELTRSLVPHVAVSYRNNKVGLYYCMK